MIDQIYGKDYKNKRKGKLWKIDIYSVASGWIIKNRKLEALLFSQTENMKLLMFT